MDQSAPAFQAHQNLVPLVGLQQDCADRLPEAVGGAGLQVPFKVQYIEPGAGSAGPLAGLVPPALGPALLLGPGLEFRAPHGGLIEEIGRASCRQSDWAS